MKNMFKIFEFHNFGMLFKVLKTILKPYNLQINKSNRLCIKQRVYNLQICYRMNYTICT